VIDDCFIVNDLRVVEGREGECFVQMPARKARNGQMRDIAHPLKSDTRREIEECVLAEYEKAVAELVVPAEADSAARKKDQPSVIDRLASKLFTDDFWTADAEPAEEQKE
jgi:stage V sporulation protein G